ncbi:hypothetical protein XELAEV_18025452mg [Xenopus laevis]|uniref:Uncharacterized protein n=1 Tax=Xenopus laevis TaxID=8355 RepID=A0A974D217_XENLA|nr:hypothetical protein XELAEV_18025452mg [Xenopus laevis]
MCNIILAACILHNIAVDNKLLWDLQLPEAFEVMSNLKVLLLTKSLISGWIFCIHATRYTRHSQRKFSPVATIPTQRTVQAEMGFLQFFWPEGLLPTFFV